MHGVRAPCRGDEIANERHCLRIERVAAILAPRAERAAKAENVRLRSPEGAAHRAPPVPPARPEPRGRACGRAPTKADKSPMLIWSSSRPLPLWAVSSMAPGKPPRGERLARMSRSGGERSTNSTATSRALVPAASLVDDLPARRALTGRANLTNSTPSEAATSAIAWQRVRNIMRQFDDGAHRAASVHGLDDFRHLRPAPGRRARRATGSLQSMMSARATAISASARDRTLASIRVIFSRLRGRRGRRFWRLRQTASDGYSNAAADHSMPWKYLSGKGGRGMFSPVSTARSYSKTVEWNICDLTSNCRTGAFRANHVS